MNAENPTRVAAFETDARLKSVGDQLEIFEPKVEEFEKLLLSMEGVIKGGLIPSMSEQLIRDVKRFGELSTDIEAMQANLLQATNSAGKVFRGKLTDLLTKHNMSWGKIMADPETQQILDWTKTEERVRNAIARYKGVGAIMLRIQNLPE